MIRNYHKQDLNRIMELWLETNIAAHDFIDGEYWQGNYDAVKVMIPEATIYIYEENNRIQGFIGLSGDYIAGLFVAAKCQSKGIGKMLLEYAKEQRTILSLSVYQANHRAVNFYLREGFSILAEEMDANTGEIELKMQWIRRNESCEK